MNTAERIIPLLLITLFIFIIFRNWFSFVNLSSGDWIYLYDSAVESFVPFSSWGYGISGLGSNKLSVFWLEGYFGPSIKFASFLPWVIYERLFWFWPYLLISLSSSYLLAKKLLKDTPFTFLAPLIYTANTYSLMIVGGGQMGVALAYSFVPFVVLAFLKLFSQEEKGIKISFFSGLLVAVLIMFDVRIAYITMLAILLLFIYIIFRKNTVKDILSRKSIVFNFIIPSMVVLAFHLYWILPLIALQENPYSLVNESLTSIESLKFFSFAKFENVFSLLHPNWPDNIFGKVSFLMPQFLLIPLLAFSSTLFLNSNSRKYILYFILVGVIGIFLAKGTNEPFGTTYIYLFEHIPGFKMFRDPTKWYILIALSFSILIPYALEKISNLKFFEGIRFVKLLIFLFFFIGWMILIKDILFAKGTFASHSVPSEYKKLADHLSSEDFFFRTLWVPKIHRFGYSSDIHPAVHITDLKKNINVEDFFEREDVSSFIKKLSIKYIIVPYDSEYEIFLTDRRYDKRLRDQLVKKISATNDVKRVEGFDRIAVFEVSNPKPQLYLQSGNNLDIQRINPTEYYINFQNVFEKEKLIFTDRYDSRWELNMGEKTIHSDRSGEGYHIFELQKIQKNAVLVYKPQQLVYFGFLGTILTLSIAGVMLIKK